MGRRRNKEWIRDGTRGALWRSHGTRRRGSGDSGLTAERLWTAWRRWQCETGEDLAVKTACRWLGATETVERNSIPTSGYSMDASPAWHEQMAVWLVAMNDLGSFNLEQMGLTGFEKALPH